MLTANIVGTDPTCFGGCDGSADMTVSGGTLSYIYSWGFGESTEDIDSLCAGTYEVTVIDANSCFDTASVTLIDPVAISANIIGTDLVCNGDSNGIANLSVSNGTLPYSYIWSSGQTSQDINNIPAGIYCVTVTDVNSCTATACVTITEPAPVIVDLGGINDSLEVPSYPYTLDAGAFATYAWSTFESTQTIQVNSDGWYSVTVTDAVGCEGSDTVYVHLPVSIEDWVNENTYINIYPNPNKGLFNIIVKTKNQGNLTIELMNVHSQVVYRNDVKDILYYTDEIDVSKFAKGTYLLRINTGNKVIVKEVIVQ